MIKKLLIFFLIFILYSLFFIHYSYATDYKSDYQVEYFLTENKKSISSKVKFNIQLTNLISDVYVNKFSINFPKSFNITNITGYDDTGIISPKIIEDNDGIKIEMEFKDPKIGKNSVNNFYLQFDQDNLFTVNGNVWEVILPTVESKEERVYKVIVNLPENNKKISLSKPKPDAINGNQIIWNNPKEKTIYAIFGDSQNYKLDLTYHLKNPQIVPVYTEIALPPDTLYQKTIIQNISETPVEVRQDEDGNFMAKYFLKPKETKTIVYSGTEELLIKPRPEMYPIIRQSAQNQEKYMTTDVSYWSLDNIANLPEFPDIKSIYDFTVATLQYNFNKLAGNNERLGAAKALMTKNQSVCVEYSDVFIALAREKGIMAREMEGYGYSRDNRLRPLSLNSDILHSWPEYYDRSLQTWVTVDPTWEHTSGIDYYNSLDLNHIVFVIHGRKPDYPLPAGMYKIENSKDILVKPTADTIQENTSLLIDTSNIPSEITDNKTIKTALTVINTGNVYQYNIPLEIHGNKVEIQWKYNGNIMKINSLAPFEKYLLPIEISSLVKNKKTNGEILINSNNFKQSKTIQIVPYYYGLVMKLFVISLMLGVPILFVVFYRKLREYRGN